MQRTHWRCLCRLPLSYRGGEYPYLVKSLAVRRILPSFPLFFYNPRTRSCSNVTEYGIAKYWHFFTSKIYTARCFQIRFQFQIHQCCQQSKSSVRMIFFIGQIFAKLISNSTWCPNDFVIAIIRVNLLTIFLTIVKQQIPKKQQKWFTTRDHYILLFIHLCQSRKQWWPICYVGIGSRCRCRCCCRTVIRALATVAESSASSDASAMSLSLAAVSWRL